MSQASSLPSPLVRRWLGLLGAMVSLTWLARSLTFMDSKALGFLSALLFLSAVFLVWRGFCTQRKLYQQWGARTALVALMLTYVGLQMPRVQLPHIDEHHCTAHAYLTQFPQDDDPVGKRFALWLQEHDCQLQQGVAVYAYDYRAETLAYGQMYELRLKIKPSQSGIIATIQADQPSALPVPFYQRWRAYLHQRLRDSLAPQWHGWLQALLLGDRSALRMEHREALKRTGTSHLIAISGLHLGLLAVMVMMMLRPLLAWLLLYRGGLVWAWALGLNVLVGGVYALLSGAEPPVTRAWLMMLGFTGLWLGRISARAWQGLGLALVMQLLFFPQDLWNVGAWLSYLAVLSLMVVYPKLRHKRLLWQFVGLQSALTLILMPLVWAAFGGISLVGWWANLVLIPYTGLLMLLGGLSLVMPSVVPLLEGLSAKYFGFLMRVAQWEGAYWEPSIQPTLVSGILLSTMALLIWLPVRYKALCWLGLGAWVAWEHGVLSRENFWLNHRYRVGVVWSEGRAIIINSGTKSQRTGRDDAVRYVLPYLRRRGVEPSALLLTEKAMSANTAVVTLKTAYPALPIYRFIPQSAFPYPTIDCTKPPLSRDCQDFNLLWQTQSALPL
ncbi:MAG: ComEC/Rec2 family competence protein [Cardiobacteriaceae bacterium]|nr:ComEC/Rec2 family competence protein [Cardiobacteriaceae bacterium]